MRVRGSEVTELDGSSIRAPYTSRRDAEDVLCSGPTRPGRQVSPEDAANAEETFSIHPLIPNISLKQRPVIRPHLSLVCDAAV